METLTVSSSMLIPATINVQLTPAMLAALWGIADELDNKHIRADSEDAVWLEIPTIRLRNPEGRNDNIWLKECLDRLTKVQLKGTYRGNDWGAVVLAEWHLLQGGTIAKLLIPPSAIAAIRAPNTFAKIEITAAYKLKGHARRLYAALADKKRLGQTHWIYSLQELRDIFDIGDRYPKWAKFNLHVLQPAVNEINDYGTVIVTITPQKVGRSVSNARFDWNWKTIDEARETEGENERHDIARGKRQEDASAPPLVQRSSKVEDILRKNGVLDDPVGSIDQRRAKLRATSKP